MDSSSGYPAARPSIRFRAGSWPVPEIFRLRFDLDHHDAQLLLADVPQPVRPSGPVEDDVAGAHFELVTVQRHQPSSGHHDVQLLVVHVVGMTTDVRSGPDRKSTRLNSSHRCISYAVFCLKKKN